MANLRGLVLEDVLHGGQLLSSLLFKLDRVEQVESLGSLQELKAFLEDNRADFVCWVTEALAPEDEAFWRSLPDPPPLILHSADPLQALAAFRLGAIDFLPTPLKLKELERALDRTGEWSAFHHWKLAHGWSDDALHVPPYFFAKSDYRIVRIPLEEILFIEALGEYIRITTAEQKVVTLYSLSKMAEWLPHRNFIRIHRSYIINLDKVNFIQNNVVSIGTFQLPISKSQRKAVLDAIQAHGLL